MILKPGKEIVLVISDLQIPFHHPDSFAFLSWLKKKYKPTQIVCIGDEVDNHGISNYIPDPDGYSAGHELRKALRYLHKLYEIFPNVKAVTSNHTDRPFRKAFQNGLPRAFLRELHDLLEAPPGWEWRDSWEIDGVYYFHGEGLSGESCAIKAVKGYQRPVVFGHLHSSASIYYNATALDLHFGFNVGCLIDWPAYAFRYGKHNMRKAIIGTGLVIKGVPVFIPMLLNKSGRWIGRKGLK